jgi:hypothetical protein
MSPCKLFAAPNAHAAARGGSGRAPTSKDCLCIRWNGRLLVSGDCLLEKPLEGWLIVSVCSLLSPGYPSAADVLSFLAAPTDGAVQDVHVLFAVLLAVVLNAGRMSC